MKNFSQTKQFSKDVKRMQKRGKNLCKLQEITKLLANRFPLPVSYKDHPLMGIWSSSRDCHIESDWILIYTLEADFLRLERTGTHSDLFK
jgi:mRNA interferase YafQ